jgi:hypothetical protein
MLSDVKKSLVTKDGDFIDEVSKTAYMALHWMEVTSNKIKEYEVLYEQFEDITDKLETLKKEIEEAEDKAKHYADMLEE